MKSGHLNGGEEHEARHLDSPGLYFVLIHASLLGGWEPQHRSK